MVVVVISVQYLFCEKTSNRKEEEEELSPNGMRCVQPHNYTE